MQVPAGCRSPLGAGFGRAGLRWVQVSGVQVSAGCRSPLGAGLRWVQVSGVQVSAGCRSPLGAGLRWVQVSAGCRSPLGAGLRWVQVSGVQVSAGCRSPLGAGLRWVPPYHPVVFRGEVSRRRVNLGHLSVFQQLPRLISCKRNKQNAGSRMCECTVFTSR